ncbi:MAG TPA: FAD-dependent oxidoreductase [Spirochaetota bacterium]|nr:FAD-dependent oxidoreductase [Spirochaetota bacterium]
MRVRSGGIEMVAIDAKNIYYRMLNRQIREFIAIGKSEIEIQNVLGQRYICAGIHNRGYVKLYGTPGQDLGAFMNGPVVEVFGNAQDGVGNTMNAGKIIVHGKAGEIPGHSMRGGKVFIRDDVEYRAAIHMKEYKDQIPVLVIGGTAKDYCGEYMAGGRVVVLNCQNREGSPVGSSLGTGIHGGAIYVRGVINSHQLGIGAVAIDIDDQDKTFLRKILSEYSMDLGVDISGISLDEFKKIAKKGNRPFANLYTPAMNISKQKPKHMNLTPPCSCICPTGIPTPVFINLIKAGKVKEAQLLMDEFTPFRMSVCGTVCPALCMESCSRNSVDTPVNIPAIAREFYPDFDPVQPKEKMREKISVIGAGPAGLSAAWQLSRRGYSVDVYDAVGDLGGKLRRAVPRERLSDEALQRDITRIKTLPINFIMNRKIDKNSFRTIYRKSDAVIIATGAYRTNTTQFPGSETVLSGLQFLVDINEGNQKDLKRKEIVIVGAGNVGMDIACESWRLGAARVTAVDIRKPSAQGKELDMAERLGTEIKWPKEIVRIENNIVYFHDGTSLQGDVVLFSIGESPDTKFLPDSVLRDERGYIVTSGKSFRSSDGKIFASGDTVKAGLVTDAVGNGRIAAMEIHALLRGQSFEYPEKNPVPKKRMNVSYFGKEDREIDRCMSCGTCIFCDKCIEACPQGALSRNGELFAVDPVICTGCYTCVNVCPRSVLQKEDFTEFRVDNIENEG